MPTLIYRQGVQRGPFEDQELSRLIAVGEISLDDLAWKEGLSEWVPLRSFYPASATPPASPPPIKGLDPKLAERLKYLHRSSRMMMAIAAIGLFIPIVLLVGAALGIVYFFQRKSLLPKIELEESMLTETQTKQVDYLRGHRQDFLVPLYVLLGYAVCLAGFIAFVTTHAK